MEHLQVATYSTASFLVAVFGFNSISKGFTRENLRETRLCPVAREKQYHFSNVKLRTIECFWSGFGRSGMPCFRLTGILDATCIDASVAEAIEG